MSVQWLCLSARSSTGASELWNRDRFAVEKGGGVRGDADRRPIRRLGVIHGGRPVLHDAADELVHEVGVRATFSPNRSGGTRRLAHHVEQRLRIFALRPFEAPPVPEDRERLRLGAGELEQRPGQPDNRAESFELHESRFDGGNSGTPEITVTVSSERDRSHTVRSI
jgi:hypothetical protein